MKVSLITVCFNSAATLGGTIESVLRQQDADIEYIVVDGGSRDRTVEIIREYAARTESSSVSFRWISEKDEGMYDALNKGIAMASGDIVGIIHADDRLEDEFVIRDVCAGFTDGIDCVYGDIRFVRGESNTTARYYSSRAWKPWMHNWGFMPAHPSIYVRREVFARLGSYKLGYDISADFEWMVRLLCRNRLATRYLPRCMVTMRLGGKSTAGLKAMYRLNVENVRANRENGYFCILPMMLPKYFYKVLGYLRKRR